MTVVIKSSTDSEEVVTAALGDLAQKPVDDKKPEEKKKVGDPVSDKPTDEPVDNPTDEPESSGDEDESEEPSEELDSKEEAKDEKLKPKKKGGFQKKIGRLEQEKEYWRQEALRAQSQRPQEKVETSPVTKDTPKASDFATHDEYVKALTRWEVKQELAAERDKERQNAIKTEFQSRLNTHHSRVEAFKEAHDDFDDALENVSTIPMSLSVQESILDSDHGPEMMYALANDPKEFKRLCLLPPMQAAREMGRLEAKFLKTESKSSEQTKTTRAPKPVTPVRTRGAAVTKDLNDPNLSYEDFKRLRQEQIKQNSMRR